MNSLPRRRIPLSRSGFSLVELLVAVAVLGMLGALTFFGYNRVRSSGEKTVSASNIRQVVMGLHLYSLNNSGFLPHQFDASRNSDWSGVLVEEEYVPEEVFHAPADLYTRRFDGTPRSYAVNSATYTFLQNGYRSPWPKDRSRANMVPATVMLVGENFGGAIENSGAVVGVAEFEGLNAETYNFYDDTGAHYCMADGSVAFMSKTEATRYRADTDYNGDPRDPWKWVP